MFPIVFAFFLLTHTLPRSRSDTLLGNVSEPVEYCDLTSKQKYCFIVHRTNRTFVDANDQCGVTGKSLLTISTKEQQRFVSRSLAEVAPHTDFWFGLYSTDDTYEWMSGQQAVPNAYMTSVQTEHDIHCFSTNGERPLYTWTRQYCDAKLWFLCGDKYSPQVSETAIPPSANTCPQGYALFGEKCFMARLAPSEKLNWQSALESCSKSTEGATLVTISSLLEQDYLSILLARFTGPSWIGMSMMNDEHHWVNDREITFTNWIPNQPNNTAEPRCTIMHQRPRHFGQWEDVVCNHELNYICQVPPIENRNLQPKPVPPIPHFQGACNTSFIEFRGRCYRVESQLTNQTNSATTTMNKQLCPSRVAPHSPEEHALMRVLLNTNFTQPASYAWVGLVLDRNFSERGSLNLKAEDGLPVSTTSALDFSLLSLSDSSRMNNANSTHCFGISSTGTNLVWLNCSTRLPSICGYALPHYALHSTDTVRCPVDWVQFGRKCFSNVHVVPRTWTDAENTCTKLQADSHLASLHSPAEQHFLSNLLNHRRSWLGLRVQLHAGNNRTLRYHWSDNSLVNYLSFGIGQPSFEFNNGAVEECVVLQHGTHDWNDVDCYDRHIFVCQIALSSEVAASPSSDLPAPVQSAPEQLCTMDPQNRSACFHFHRDPREFLAAELECRSHNTTLLTVLSKHDQQFLEQALRNLTRGSPIKAFIGLFSTPNGWRWTSSYHSLPATYWSTGYPNSSDKCVYIDTNADPLRTWKSGSCDEPLPFLCSTVPPLIGSSPASTSNYGCQTNFTRTNNGCFLVNSTGALTWEEASSACAQLGSNVTLAVVKSSNDQDVLTALLGLTSSSVWIGLRLVDGIHHWANGFPVTYTNWGLNQPEVQGTRCVSVDGRMNHLGEWRDEDCSLRKGFVCQAPPFPFNQQTASPTPGDFFYSGRCVQGFYEYRNRCISLSTTPFALNRSSIYHRDAISNLCSRSTVATCGTPQSTWGITPECSVVTAPNTLADTAFMRTMLRTFGSGAKEAWVGLKLNVSEGPFRIVSEDVAAPSVSQLQTLEIDLSAYHSFRSGTQRFGCVILSTMVDHLTTVNCSKTGLPFFCSYSLDAESLLLQSTLPPIERCPPNWTVLRGKCFRFVGSLERLSWEEAEKHCQSLAQGSQSITGHLASVHSAAEQRFLSDLAPASSFWTGLRVNPLLPSSALSQLLRIHFSWSDRSPVDYLAIPPDPFEPDRSVELCFSVHGPDAYWRPSECYQPRPFMCQLTFGDPMEPDTKRSAITAFDVVAGSPNPMPACDPHFPLKSVAGSSCYRLFETDLDWASAESVCRDLYAGAHLASLHSMQEMNQLALLLANKTKGDIWIGLYESQLAYAWSDSSPVNFIPLSADRSKDARHLSQDCFVLSTSPKTDFVTLKAVDCKSKPPAFVCQQRPSVAPPVSDASSWTFVLCPPGYHQYGDRCFSVLSQLMSWSDGNRTCSEQAMAFRGYSGSLARIENALVQEFVASLLDALPAKSSSAWIGLRRNLSDESPQFHWADTDKVEFLRPVYHAQNVPVIHLAHIGNASNSGIDLTLLPQLCTALYRSTYPRLNGLWLQWSCEEAILLPSICQAVPPAGMNWDNVVRNTESYECPIGFYLGTTGLSASAASLTGPVCYRLLSATVTFDWKSANEGCKSLSYEDFNVSLLSIGSVFEASFLRFWLQLPRAVSGAELPADTSVWSALRVLADCPECYRNWTWANIQSEPVRYTDWLIPPSSPRGCYVFIADPYMRQSLMSDNGLGSIQPAASCEVNHFAVCQAPAKNAVLHEAVPHQLTRPFCSRVDQAASPSAPVSINTNSHTGKPCLRWDLVPANLTYFPLESNWMRHRVHTSEEVGGDGNPSYAEHFCSLWYNAKTEHFDYGCYVQLDPPLFEVCDLSYCDLPIAYHASLLSPALIASFLFSLALLLILLAIATWRGCFQHARSGYRRLFTPASFHRKRSRASLIQFMPPDTLSGLPSHEINDPTMNVMFRKSTTQLRHNVNSTGPVNTQTHTIPPTELGTAGLTSILAPAPLVSVRNGMSGYANPIYNPTLSNSPEDDYDPEAEL